MPARLRSRIGLQFGLNSQFYPFLNSFTHKTSELPQKIQTLNFRMVTQSGSTKRPTCPSCSKPVRICLCNRLRTPTLNNSVAVTILQHSLEKRHPLNSTRIATLGFKNVNVITVSDVNSQARFFIRSLDASCIVDRVKLDDSRHVFDEMPSEGEEDNEFIGMEEIIGNSSKSGAHDIDFDEKNRERIDFSSAKMRQIWRCTSQEEATLGEKGEIVINFTIGKYGAIISSFINCRMVGDKSQEIMSFHQLLASGIFIDCISKGFVVKKIQTKLLEGINENEEIEITVRPGSVLLFPSETSVDIDDVNFEIKNLIVLDGTWAKAKRMYNENPWLRLLPHVRLDLDNKSSLYGEVRHQPKDGYLSTIESIVYAMKAVGEEEEDLGGLDGLLDVFELMVGDQRRCKNERLSKAAQRRCLLDSTLHAKQDEKTKIKGWN